MIKFQNIKHVKLNFNKTSTWLNSVITEENKKLGPIVYVFCDDYFLIKKNMEFLGSNALTDVIAFDYSNKKTVSGDILVSVERVEENANVFNVHFLDELQRVMVHGLLHLLGYKDKTNDSIFVKTSENGRVTQSLSFTFASNLFS